MLTESSHLDHLSNDTVATPRAQQLARIVDMLSQLPEVRGELVADINHQLAERGYMSEEKLDIAIGLLLTDILR